MTTIKEKIEYLELYGQKVFFSSSESMTEIENDTIDTIITSPPYNRGKKYSDSEGNQYNDKLPEKEYQALLLRVWNECFRILNPKGVFFLNIGDSAQDQGKSEMVVKLAETVGFIRIQTIIWIKSFLGRGHYTPSGGDKRLNNIWEHIFILVKDKKKFQIYPKDIGIPYADKSNIGRYAEADLRDAGNIWFIPYSKTTGATIKKGHDAPFPIELPLKCMQLTRAKTVVDPFLGTGATLSAAKILGVSGFGYEKYPRKDVIQEVISSGSTNLLENMRNEQILLPHLDLTLNYLLDIIKVVEEVRLEQFIQQDSNLKIKEEISKKAQEQREIVIDVLKKMELFEKIAELF